MNRFLTHNLLPSSIASKRIRALWEEYEEQATREAIFVKDLDWFELAAQAVEYERGSSLALSHNRPLLSDTHCRTRSRYSEPSRVLRDDHSFHPSSGITALGCKLVRTSAFGKV
jgi:putative hydrolase of HD superfamily